MMEWTIDGVGGSCGRDSKAAGREHLRSESPRRDQPSSPRRAPGRRPHRVRRARSSCRDVRPSRRRARAAARAGWGDHGLSRRARSGRARLPRLGDRSHPTLSGPARSASARSLPSLPRSPSATGSPATTATSCAYTCARSTISRRSSTASRRTARPPRRSSTRRRFPGEVPRFNLDTTSAKVGSWRHG